MKKAILLTLCAVLFFALQAAQAGAPKPGEAAPELTLQSLLQAGRNTEQSIKSLQGKVVVLEFWATWCAPCIGVMPHLNELSEKYKSRDVQFISITDENEAKVKPFLKKRSISGWVGIDETGKLHEAYNVQYIPFTVIIGKDGRVLGYPKSSELTEEILEKALAGELITKPNPAPVTVATKLAKPLYELSIRPSERKTRSGMTGPDIFSMKGTDAYSLLLSAYGTTKARVQLQTKLPADEWYDVIATNPLNQEKDDWAWREPLQQMVQEMFKVKAQKEEKQVPVYELITGPTTAKRLQKAAADDTNKTSTASGVLSGRKANIAILVNNLEEALGVPVVDETQLTGNYNYDLFFDPKNPESLLQVLEKDTGLKLKKSTRTLDVLVVADKH